MSKWPSTKAREVLSALLRIGWTIKRHRGDSHRVLERAAWPDFIFAFHDELNWSSDVVTDRQAYRS
jgi:predicted RNA binding protein YcfA (HicA-like mRNA interferase family)